MNRTRTADCPGCGHPQPLTAHRLIAHHTDGTPLPVAEPDYTRMCPWSLTRPDATHPASATVVCAAQRGDTTQADHQGRDRHAPAREQMDLLDLLDTSTTSCTKPRDDLGA